MARHLPPLNGLRAFEAAARCGSFAGAGAELHVSPAAVSRLVRLLEERLGVTLFSRQANRLRLSDEGARVRPLLSAMFDELESMFADLRRDQAAQTLVIGVGPSFARYWLIPRLGEWQRRAPSA